MGEERLRCSLVAPCAWGHVLRSINKLMAALVPYLDAVAALPRPASASTDPMHDVRLHMSFHEVASTKQCFSLRVEDRVLSHGPTHDSVFGRDKETARSSIVSGTVMSSVRRPPRRGAACGVVARPVVILSIRWQLSRLVSRP